MAHIQLSELDKTHHSYKAHIRWHVHQHKTLRSDYNVSAKHFQSAAKKASNKVVKNIQWSQPWLPFRNTWAGGRALKNTDAMNYLQVGPNISILKSFPSDSNEHPGLRTTELYYPT